MKFNISFRQDEIRLTLTESLKLPVERSQQTGSIPVPYVADPFPKIEVLAQQFLIKLVADRGGSV